MVLNELKKKMFCELKYTFLHALIVIIFAGIKIEYLQFNRNFLI